MHKSNILFCLLLIASQGARGADAAQKNHAAQQENTENLGRWAQFRNTVHETEQQSPLLFNAAATVCEITGALGSIAVAAQGTYYVTIEKDSKFIIEVAFSPIPYLACRYCFCPLIRLAGGTCVQTKNWIFGSPKKADNDATQQ